MAAKRGCTAVFLALQCLSYSQSNRPSGNDGTFDFLGIAVIDRSHAGKRPGVSERASVAKLMQYLTTRPDMEEIKAPSRRRHGLRCPPEALSSYVFGRPQLP
jgi:hypothetical protein